MDSNKLFLFSQIKPYLGQSIENCLRDLLETKHIYQYCKVELPSAETINSVIQRLLAGVTTYQEGLDFSTETIEENFSKSGWQIDNRYYEKGEYLAQEPDFISNQIKFVPPTVKLFCNHCKRTEAFNFLSGLDLLQGWRSYSKNQSFENEQIFELTYQCQSCKCKPEIFLINREELKLIQSGRVPIETLEISTVIPKNQKGYFANAILAYNSKQTLSGIFQLRTFIEQYLRKNSKSPESTDMQELFSEYMNKLPNDFKQRFPSLESIYNDLSRDIHLAIASEDTFKKSRDSIIEHFKAKNLFRLSD